MIIKVTINKNGMTARDDYANTYKIESIIVGTGKFQKEVKWTKNFLIPDSECERAEILPNGKIKILLR